MTNDLPVGGWYWSPGTNLEDSLPLTQAAGPISALSGALLRRVFDSSPGSTLRFERWHHTVFSDAEHGMIDLLIHGGTAPPPLRSQVLFEEGYACLVASAGCATPSRTRCDKARQRPRTSKNEMAAPVRLS